MSKRVFQTAEKQLEATRERLLVTSMLRRELGLTSDQMRERITTELLVQARAEQPQELAKQGRPGKGDNYNVLSEERGTSADYLTARIARDRPDILDGMKQGKYRSVRAAAIDAGSAAQWQNVMASHKELTDAIRDALVSCRELRQHLRDVQAEVQHGT